MVIEPNIGFIIGFGLLLGTLVAIGLVIRHFIKEHTPEENRESALKLWRSGFWGIILVAIVGFVVAFAWTGWNFVPEPNQPQGELSNEAGQLEVQVGENRPEERIERLKEGDKIQEEGQEKLNEFRTKFFKKKEEEKQK